MTPADCTFIFRVAKTVTSQRAIGLNCVAVVSSAIGASHHIWALQSKQHLANRSPVYSQATGFFNWSVGTLGATVDLFEPG
jgi:hypothetical protein